jgi:hypothetical protein
MRRKRPIADELSLKQLDTPGVPDEFPLNCTALLNLDVDSTHFARIESRSLCIKKGRVREAETMFDQSYVRLKRREELIRGIPICGRH